MRGRMDEGPFYAPPVSIGEVMEGGTVAEVIESRSPKWKPGDIVLSYAGWQEYAVADPEGLRKLNPSTAPISTALVPIHEGCDVFCQEKELVSKLEGKLGDDHKVTEFESGSNDLFAECCHIVLVGVADLFDKPMSP